MYDMIFFLILLSLRIYNLFTSYYRYAVPDTPYAVPSTITCSDLNQLVNELLKGNPAQPLYLDTNRDDFVFLQRLASNSMWSSTSWWLGSSYECRSRSTCRSVKCLRNLWLKLSTSSASPPQSLRTASSMTTGWLQHSPVESGEQTITSMF